MKPKKYFPWFLGPHGENEKILENTIVQTIRDHCYWRRNFYTQDPIFISESEKQSEEFLAFQSIFMEALDELNLRMKGSAPLFSPRYAGHMLSDPGIPSMVGHFIGALYNNNNTVEEVAPITLQLEKEASQMIVKMLKYPETSWGYFTSGGSLANFQCLWRARDTRLYPFMLAIAYTQATGVIKNKLDSLKLSKWGTFKEIIEKDFLKLLTVDDAISLLNQVIALDDDYAIFYFTRKYSIYTLGVAGFVEKGRECLKDLFPTSFKWLVNKSIHYSIDKSLNFLGVGNLDILPVSWTNNAVLDTAHMEELLDDTYAKGGIVMALVGIFGTTEVGSVDDFSSLVKIRKHRRENSKGDFWLHADCAWGGYYLSIISPENDVVRLKKFMNDLVVNEFEDLPKTLWRNHLDAWAERFSKSAIGIEESDSITMDPHKAGYVPYAAGVCLFKNYIVREIAPYSFPVINARYHQLTTLQEKIWDIPFMAFYTIEGSRPSTGAISTWLMHKTIPLNQENHGLIIGKSVANAIIFEEYLNQQVIEDEDFSIKFIFLEDIPMTGITCFTLQIKHKNEILSLKTTNRILREIYELTVISPEIQLHIANFFLTKTTLSSNMYENEIQELLRKSMIPGKLYLEKDGKIHPWQDDNKMVLLRNVFMNPFSENRGARAVNYHFFLKDCAVYVKDVALKATKKVINTKPLKEERIKLEGNIVLIEENEEWSNLIKEQLLASFETTVYTYKHIDEAAKLLEDSSIKLVILGGRLGHSCATILDKCVSRKDFKGIVCFTYLDFEEVQEEVESIIEACPDWKIQYLKQPVQGNENIQHLLNKLSEMVWQIEKFG